MKLRMFSNFRALYAQYMFPGIIFQVVYTTVLKNRSKMAIAWVFSDFVMTLSVYFVPQ